ncbi:hypothetical protein Hanom_Chr09g00842131 [Helianthus anomalus]
MLQSNCEGVCRLRTMHQDFVVLSPSEVQQLSEEGMQLLNSNATVQARMNGGPVLENRPRTWVGLLLN